MYLTINGYAPAQALERIGPVNVYTKTYGSNGILQGPILQAQTGGTQCSNNLVLLTGGETDHSGPSSPGQRYQVPTGGP